MSMVNVWCFRSNWANCHNNERKLRHNGNFLIDWIRIATHSHLHTLLSHLYLSKSILHYIMEGCSTNQRIASTSKSEWNSNELCDHFFFKNKQVIRTLYCIFASWHMHSMRTVIFQQLRHRFTFHFHRFIWVGQTKIVRILFESNFTLSINFSTKYDQLQLVFLFFVCVSFVSSL